MFEDLNHCLGWTVERTPDKGLLLITSEGTDGGFLLHHFISFFLKRKLPVCVVTLAQTFSHYAQAGSKIGSNLDRGKAEGLVSHVDLMGAFTHNVLGIAREEQSVPNAGWTAKRIFLKIKSEIEKTLKSRAIENGLLVIDDISLMCSLGMQIQEVKDLFHYLTVFAKSVGLLFVTVVPTFMDDSYSHLQTYAIHSAEAVVQVKALSSGYSKDVHGHLQLRKGNETGTWQYKLTDKNLSLFAKGTSSAVL